MSPRNRQALLEKVSVNEPDAPAITIAGKTMAMQAISKMPLRETVPVQHFPPMNGTRKRTSRAAEQSQNAPLIFLGRNVRARSIPIENGKSILSRPPVKLTQSRVQPTPMLP